MALLTHARGKTKASCPCGAQGPMLPDDQFAVWKRSEAGREWYSRHNPHGRSQVVERGGRRESLDESVAKVEKSRTKASRHEIEALVKKFNEGEGL